MEIQSLCDFFEATHQNVKKADESYIRVMTSNILHSRDSKPRQVDWSSEERAEIQSALFLTFLPDFIGLQEVSYEQTPWFEEKLSEVYALADTALGDCINYPYHGVNYIQNHIPMFYNKHKYELLSSRYHLFEEKSLWGYQWALYQWRNAPEQKIIHMNLQFFSGIAEQRRRGVLETHRELLHLRRHYPNVPMVLTGDYNLTEQDESFRLLHDGLSMETAMNLTEQNDKDIGWCHDLGSMKIVMGKGTYDHISVTTDLCDVKLHRVLYDERIVRSSDHNPMFVDLVLK